MSDARLLCMTVIAAVMARTALAVPLWVIVAALGLALLARHPPLLAVPIVLAVGWHAHHDLARIEVPPRGEFAGWVSMVDDAAPGDYGTSAEVRLPGGRRVLAVASDALAGDLAPMTMGSRLRVRGRLGPVARRTDRSVSRHLAGTLHLSALDATSSGPLPYVLADRVRSTLIRGAAAIGDDGGALFEGLVLGDDRHQDDLTRHRFRASGLSHLLVVSGENVAFVFVVVSPLVGRLSLRWRLVATFAVLVGFGTLVRWEPSVLRAIAMSSVTAVAAFRGRRVSALRALSLAVGGLILLDPLICWSLGFWLSVSATLGLVCFARPVARRLGGPPMVAEALGVVLAAQLGAAPLIVTVFGAMPAAALVANLVAVPAAGWVMVWGCTAGVIAGVGPTWLATVIHVPTRVLEWWIATVARVAASPGLPMLGPVASCVLAAAVGLWLARASPGVARTWLAPSLLTPARRAVVAGSLVVVAVHLGLVAPSPGDHPLGRGAVAFVGRDGESALVLGGSIRVDDTLDALALLHLSSFDVVIVTASGAARPAGTVIDELGATRVLAADRSGLPSAAALAPGRVRLGSLVLDVTERDGRFSASVTSG